MSMILRVKSPVASRTSAMKRLRGLSKCSMSNAGKKVSLLLKGFIPFSWKAELLEQCPGHSSGPMAVWLQCPEVTSQGFDGKSWLYRCQVQQLDIQKCTYFYSFCSHGRKKHQLETSVTMQLHHFEIETSASHIKAWMLSSNIWSTIPEISRPHLGAKSSP